MKNGDQNLVLPPKNIEHVRAAIQRRPYLFKIQLVKALNETDFVCFSIFLGFLKCQSFIKSLAAFVNPRKFHPLS